MVLAKAICFSLAINDDTESVVLLLLHILEAGNPGRITSESPVGIPTRASEVCRL